MMTNTNSLPVSNADNCNHPDIAQRNNHSRLEAGFIISGILSLLLVVILFSALFVLMLNGRCNMHNVKGNGIPGELQVELNDFNRLRLGGTVNARVTQCPITSVVIRGDENLLPLVNFEIDQGVLEIENKRGFTPRLELIIDICTPTLEGITLSGAADLTAVDLICEKLELRLSGVGDLNFSGQADYLEVRLTGVGDLLLTGKATEMDAVVSGVGDLNAADLETESVTVKVSGVGDAVVFPRTALDARVSGVGDVIYYGSPTKVSRHVSGAGEIIHRNNQ